MVEPLGVCHVFDMFPDAIGWVAQRVHGGEFHSIDVVKLLGLSISLGDAGRRVRLHWMFGEQRLR